MYQQYVQKCRLVGSEDYNAPEIMSEEVYADIASEQEIKQKSE